MAQNRYYACARRLPSRKVATYFRNEGLLDDSRRLHCPQKQEVILSLHGKRGHWVSSSHRLGGIKRGFLYGLFSEDVRAMPARQQNGLSSTVKETVQEFINNGNGSGPDSRHISIFV